MAYYRARAPWYDDAYISRGDYDQGPTLNAQWRADLAAIEALMSRANLHGDCVELGAGTGYWTERIVDRADRVWALDAVAEVLTTARERLGERAAKVQFDVVDLWRWNPERIWDCAVACFFFEHVPDEVLPDLLQTLHASLRPGGTVFLAEGAAVEAEPQVETREIGGRTFRVVERRRQRVRTDQGLRRRWIHGRDRRRLPVRVPHRYEKLRLSVDRAPAERLGFAAGEHPTHRGSGERRSDHDDGEFGDRKRAQILDLRGDERDVGAGGAEERPQPSESARGRGGDPASDRPVAPVAVSVRNSPTDSARMSPTVIARIPRARIMPTATAPSRTLASVLDSSRDWMLNPYCTAIVRAASSSAGESASAFVISHRPDGSAVQPRAASSEVLMSAPGSAV